ncbi:MAG: transcription antitermination factor NusB [Dehalococcoidales bacterium]|jgi:N utilization substance protein B|nr:transcription antitermination factor NusB [Dehalococcoidales bacterium]MDD3264599.1 transcription antitermination factor NusB [Dehalococcoidales bacterium]MDD4322084.1 transcription antitermination factor NusB [Dehalococcoidales bacterium]MDD4793655.1 transcription antitermination factor NusB [Dehalococcoidales bacterium]MDD5122158.1 transcription antitermination factor NusB [Dehalococcoidales bacterium]
MVSSRRKSRSLALQALYEIDLAGHPGGKVAESVLEGAGLSKINEDFVKGLVNGITANKDQIDGYIKRYAPAWPLAQLPAIDRNILRLSIYELLYLKDTPVKVAINEAIELAKSFGSDSSPKFINGVLSSVYDAILKMGDSLPQE